MEAEIITTASEPLFEPFDLIIHVKSIDEARALWHRFNVTCKNSRR